MDLDLYTAPLTPRTSMDNGSANNSPMSSPQAASAPPTPSLRQKPVQQQRTTTTEDLLLQSTLGLPLPHNTRSPTTTTFSSAPAADTSTHQTHNPTTKILPPASRTESSARRLSQLISSARTGLDSFVRRSATFFLDETDESALVIEWRWESASGRRKEDNGLADNVIIGKDGWVEGWLD